MEKIFSPFLFSVLLLASCQKELSFPDLGPVDSVYEKVVAAIVITNAGQGDYDSIVYRYLPDETREIHFDLAGDSITRTYFYDVSGRLIKLEDEHAIYYTNNDVARRISFLYNNSGQLVQTLTDFTTVSGVPAYYNNDVAGTGKNIIVYDTSYTGLSYNLDWANRIIYNTLTSNNYILYDSCIYINNNGKSTTKVSSYTYDADNNATGIIKNTYQNNQLAEWGTTIVTRDKPAPVYEALCKKLYRNLVNWYESSSVAQDDNYQLFPVPGNMVKSIVYSGYSINGGPVPFEVIRSTEFDNTYDTDLLLKSVITFSLEGQGTTHYTNEIKYYYR